MLSVVFSCYYLAGMKNRYYPLILLSLCLLLGEFASAQIPSLSPPGRLQQTVGNTEVTITYERPLARGRTIFGGLVPWGKTWRTGAGYCTKISFSQPVRVGGQSVAAGKYALLTIPNPEEWIVILNSDTTLYSARDHDPGRDVIRTRVRPVTTSRHYEALTFDLDLVAGDNARLYLSWANTQVSFPILTSTADEVSAHIEHLLAQPPNAELDYAWPAEHLFLGRKDFNQALALIDRQMKIGENEYAYNVRRMIYEYLGQPKLARQTVEQAIAFRKANPLDEKNQAWSLAEWTGHAKRLSQ